MSGVRRKHARRGGGGEGAWEGLYGQNFVPKLSANDANDGRGSGRQGGGRRRGYLADDVRSRAWIRQGCTAFLASAHDDLL
mmetsp:Transcript_3274/g.8121  ORF Transcript_3274/g.8121 Transcript_3274/m.8121 type:complete len:81 (+) Transcript_3274:1515-1757(+)